VGEGVDPPQRLWACRVDHPTASVARRGAALHPPLRIGQQEVAVVAALQAYDEGHAARSRLVASQPRGAMRRPPWRLRSATALLRHTIRRTAQPPASTSVRLLTVTTRMSTGLSLESRQTAGNDQMIEGGYGHLLS
jgi:hypothetical protein